MKKKKSTTLKFKSENEMDSVLESMDLSEVFQKYGKVQEPKISKINLDLPEWIIRELDIEAQRAGVSRQPLIKLWLVQKLDEERKKRVA